MKTVCEYCKQRLENPCKKETQAEVCSYMKPTLLGKSLAFLNALLKRLSGENMN